MGRILTLHRPPTTELPGARTRVLTRAVDRISRPRSLDVHRDPLGLVRTVILVVIGEVVLLGGGVVLLQAVQQRDAAINQASPESAVLANEPPAGE